MRMSQMTTMDVFILNVRKILLSNPAVEVRGEKVLSFCHGDTMHTALGNHALGHEIL